MRGVGGYTSQSGLLTAKCLVREGAKRASCACAKMMAWCSPEPNFRSCGETVGPGSRTSSQEGSLPAYILTRSGAEEFSSFSFTAGGITTEPSESCSAPVAVYGECFKGCPRRFLACCGELRGEIVRDDEGKPAQVRGYHLVEIRPARSRLLRMGHPAQQRGSGMQITDRFCAMAHLSDDEAVAKMGHSVLWR